MSKLINRTGETNIAKNGQKMTIIAYKNSNDIDIQFEDGTIVTNKQYDRFMNGIIKNPNLVKTYIGETIKAKNGQMMTIIAYRNSKDIDIQFEDGVIVNKKSYNSFKRGVIKHPKIDCRKKNRVGESVLANCNKKATIIEDNGCNNLTIQFEDGEIVSNIDYQNFKLGYIRHPKIGNPLILKNDKTGEVNIAKNGLKMTIIKYRNVNDIDIQFEDGVIVEHKYYAAFKNGNIKHPKFYARTKNCKSIYINKSILCRNGLYATIINFNNSYDITVKFEDGYITNITRSQFIDNCIKHPFPFQFNDIILEKPAYVYNNIGNFYCTCSKCGYKDIMTIEEMKDHMSNCIDN